MKQNRINRAHFPYVAAILGGVLLVILLLTDGSHGDTGFTLPLLTLLLISEFGFLVTGAGAFLGAREWVRNGFRHGVSLVAVMCGLLSVWFAIRGYAIWEHVSALKG